MRKDQIACSLCDAVYPKSWDMACGRARCPLGKKHPSDVDQAALDQDAIHQKIAREAIASKAANMRLSAEGIARYSRMLSETPPYDATCETALSDAELVLTASLLVVKLARSQYASLKPVSVAAE